MEIAQPHVLFKTIVSVAIATSTFSPILTTASPVRRSIGEAEFIQYIKTDQVVSNRTIKSDTLAGVLEWADANRKALGDFTLIRIEACDVEGELDLHQRTIEVPVAIHQTTFKDRILCQGTRFHDPVNFAGCTFQGIANFEKAIFDDLVDFTGAEFVSFAWFQDVTFCDADFYNATFDKLATFSGATFQAIAKFEGCHFHGDADFAGSVIQRSARFKKATFSGVLTVRHAKITNDLAFVDAVFEKDVFFDDLDGLPHGHIQFFGSLFKSRVYFDDSKLESLRFSPRFSDSEILGLAAGDPKQEKTFSARFYSPTAFEKIAIFRNVDLGEGDFTEAEFQDYVDFTGAIFRETAKFFDTTFKTEVNFQAAQFAADASTELANEKGTVGLLLDRVHFRDRVGISWYQLVYPLPFWKIWADPNLKLRTAQPSTWYALEEVFRRSDNLTGRNEAHYQQRLLATGPTVQERENWITNRCSWFYWGYGFRPWRIVALIVCVFLIFTTIYWTQIPSPADSNFAKAEAYRIRQALVVSFNTSWKLDYGRAHARTIAFRIITLAQSVVSKLMFLSLLHVISNVSPLLNAFIGKLLPI